MFKLKHHQYGYLFVAPFIIGFLVFGLYPVVNTIVLSFTDRTLMSSSYSFTGLRNFQLLFADKTFITAIKNTWQLWLMNFIPQMGIAFLLSIWFTNNRLKLRGVGVWRMIFYMPQSYDGIGCMQLFSFHLFSFYGPVNQFLVRAGFLPKPLTSSKTSSRARFSRFYPMVGCGLGQTTILLMAAMTAISPSLYESSPVDGAGTIQMFSASHPAIDQAGLSLCLGNVFGWRYADVRSSHTYSLMDGEVRPILSSQTLSIVMKISQQQGSHWRRLCRGSGSVPDDQYCRAADFLPLT
jgi:multiple sugar transport system permease protein